MRNSSCIRAVVPAIAVAGASMAVAQDTHAPAHPNRQSGSSIHRQLIDIPILRKKCSFHLVTLPQTVFQPMFAVTATFPADFLGKGFPQMEVVLLQYSHTGQNGGVLRMYEAAPLKSLTPAELMRKIVASGVFKESTKGPWVIRPMVVSGVVVAPSGTVSAAVDDAVIALKR